MKRSPSSSSSSSSSPLKFENPIQSKKKSAAKNPKKNINPKSQNFKKKNQSNGGIKRSSIYRGVTRFKI